MPFSLTWRSQSLLLTTPHTPARAQSLWDREQPAALKVATDSFPPDSIQMCYIPVPRDCAEGKHPPIRNWFGASNPVLNLDFRLSQRSALRRQRVLGLYLTAVRHLESSSSLDREGPLRSPSTYPSAQFDISSVQTKRTSLFSLVIAKK